MLLIAAILLATSSFAWFSMNTTVTVTGMEVTAKSDSVYLLVGGGDNDTAEEIQAEQSYSASVTINSAATHIRPSTHTDAVVDAATALNPANWYFKYADAPNASESTRAANVLTSENYANYVIHYVCYVTVAKGSNPATNLVVGEVSMTPNGSATGDNATIAPIKVLVATENAVAELDATTLTSDTVLASEVTDTDVVQIDILVYYNGEDAAVFTNNTANLDGASIDITFEVD